MRWFWVCVVVLVVTGCDDASTSHSGHAIVDLTQSELSVAPILAVAGVDTVAVAVTLRDGNGDPVSGEVVTIAATGTDNDLPPLAATSAQGTSATTWTSTHAETKTLTATLADGSLLGTADVTFVPGAPAQLVFSMQPQDTEAGGPISATVRIEDAYANLAPAGNIAVTLDLATNPGAASLSGSTTVVSQAAQAAFSGLTIVVPAAGYTLRASGLGLTEAVSEPFDVVAGEPVLASSTFSISPHSNDADGISTDAIQVALRNQYNVPIASYPVTLAASGTGNVLAPASGVTDAAGTLTGTLATTVAEPKEVTVTAGALTWSATVYFYAPACTLQLPLRPQLPFTAKLDAYAAADVDGDTEIDSIEALDSGVLVVRRGRGDGRFRAPIESTLPSAVQAIYTADLDGDGHLDVLALHESAAMSVLLGNGDGTFDPGLTTTLAQAAHASAIGDFDGDGILDVVVPTPGSARLDLFKGVGDGTFGAAVAISVSASVAEVISVDLDVNGKLDLVAATDSQVLRLLGTGNGTFGTPQVLNTSSSAPLLKVANLNADTYPDVLVVGVGADYVLALTGSSTGTLAIAWSISTGVQSPGVATGDFDGDGDTDFLLSRAPLLAHYSSNGNGTFTRVRDYTTDGCGAGVGLWRGGLVAADIDGDAYLDVLSACRSLAVITGRAGGAFNAPINYAGSHAILFDTAANFNTDNRIDLAAFTLDDGNTAWLTQASGSLVKGGAMGTGQPADGAVADVDGDGKADLVVVQAGAFRAELGRGTGTGTFTAAPDITFPSVYAEQIALADVSGDGKVDMILRSASVGSRGVHVAFGTGTGTFGAFTRYDPGSDPRDIVVTDLDGDGDRDIAMSTTIGTGSDGTLTVYANDGTGAFAKAFQLPTGERMMSLVAGDFNGDGTPDLAVLGTTIRVYAGPTWTAIGDPYPPGTPPSPYAHALATADLDGDGTLDLIANTDSGNWVLQGYPDGYFRPARLYGHVNVSGLTIGAPPVLTDMDGNGSVDLAFASGSGIGVALQRTCLPFSP